MEKSSFVESDANATPDESFAEEDAGLDMEVEEIENDNLDDTFDDEVEDEPGPDPQQAVHQKGANNSVITVMSQPFPEVSDQTGQATNKGGKGKFSLKDILGKPKKKAAPRPRKPSQKGATMKSPDGAPTVVSTKAKQSAGHSLISATPKWTPTDLAIQSLGKAAPRPQSDTTNTFISGVPPNAHVAQTQHIIIQLEAPPDEAPDSPEYSPSKFDADAPYSFTSPGVRKVKRGVDKSMLPPSPPSEDGYDDEATMHIEIIVMSEDEGLQGLQEEDMEDFDEYIVTAEGASLKEATIPPPPVKAPRKALPTAFKQRAKSDDQPKERRGLPKPNIVKASQVKPPKKGRPRKSPVALTNQAQPPPPVGILKPLVIAPIEITPKSSMAEKKPRKTKQIDASQRRAHMQDEVDVKVETKEETDGTESYELPDTPDLLDMSAEEKWDFMVARDQLKEKLERKGIKVEKKKKADKLAAVTNLETQPLVKDIKIVDVQGLRLEPPSPKKSKSDKKYSKKELAKANRSKSKENKLKRSELKKHKAMKSLGLQPKQTQPLTDEIEEDDIAETIIIRHNASPSPPPKASKKGRISIRDIIGPKNYFLKKKKEKEKSKAKQKASDSAKKSKVVIPPKTLVSELPKYTNTVHPEPPMERKHVKPRHCVPDEIFKIVANPTVDTPKSAMSGTPRTRDIQKHKQEQVKHETPKTTTPRPDENIYSKKYTTNRRLSSTRGGYLAADENTPTRPEGTNSVPHGSQPAGKATPKGSSSPSKRAPATKLEPRSPFVRPLSSKGLSKLKSPPGVKKGRVVPIPNPITDKDLAQIPRRNAKIEVPVPEAEIVISPHSYDKKDAAKHDHSESAARKGRTPTSKKDTPKTSRGHNKDAKNVKVSSGEKGRRSAVIATLPDSSDTPKRGRNSAAGSPLVSPSRGRTTPKTSRRSTTRRASSEGVDYSDEPSRKARPGAASTLLKKAVKRLQKSGHKAPSPPAEDKAKRGSGSKYKALKTKSRSTSGKSSKLNVSMFRNIEKEGIMLSPSVARQITKETSWQPQIDIKQTPIAKEKTPKGTATKRSQGGSAKRDTPEISPPRKKMRGGQESAVASHTLANARRKAKLKSPPDSKSTSDFNPIVTSVTSLSSATKSPTSIRSSRFITIKSPLAGESPKSRNEKTSAKIKSPPVRDRLSQGSRFAGSRLSPPSASQPSSKPGPKSSKTKGLGYLSKNDAGQIKKRLESKLHPHESRFESRGARSNDTPKTGGKSSRAPGYTRAVSPPIMTESPLLALMREARSGGIVTSSPSDMESSATPKQRPSRLRGTNKKAVSSNKAVTRVKSPQPLSGTPRRSSSSGQSSPLTVGGKSNKDSQQTPTTKSTKLSSPDASKSASKLSSSSPQKGGGPILPFTLRTEDAPMLTDDLIEQAIKTRPGAVPRAVGKSRARQLLKKAAARQNESAARQAAIARGSESDGGKKESASAAGSGAESPKVTQMACGFRIGHRLEAIDKNNAEFTCVASVADIKGGRLRVHFDGWEAGYDFWCRPESQYIHPVGWCQANGKPLSPPQDWEDIASFTWDRYLDKINASPAPLSVFRQQSKTNALIQKAVAAKPPSSPRSSQRRDAVVIECPKHMQCVVEVDRLKEEFIRSGTIDLLKMDIVPTRRGSGKGRRAQRPEVTAEAISPVITGVASITTEMFQQETGSGSPVKAKSSSPRKKQQKDNIFDMFQKDNVAKSADATSTKRRKSSGSSKKQSIEAASGALSDATEKPPKEPDMFTQLVESIAVNKEKKPKRRERQMSSDSSSEDGSYSLKPKRRKRRLATSEERELSDSLEQQMSLDEDSNDSTASSDKSGPVVKPAAKTPKESGTGTAEIPKKSDSEKVETPKESGSSSKEIPNTSASKTETVEKPMETNETAITTNELSHEEKEERTISSTSTETDACDSSSTLKEGIADSTTVSQDESATVTDSENMVSSTEPTICENVETPQTESQDKSDGAQEEQAKTDTESTQDKQKERNIFDKLTAENPPLNPESSTDNQEASDPLFSDHNTSYETAEEETEEAKESEAMDTTQSVTPAESQPESDVAKEPEQDFASMFLNKITPTAPAATEEAAPSDITTEATPSLSETEALERPKSLIADELQPPAVLLSGDQEPEAPPMSDTRSVDEETRGDSESDSEVIAGEETKDEDVKADQAPQETAYKPTAVYAHSEDSLGLASSPEDYASVEQAETATTSVVEPSVLETKETNQPAAAANIVEEQVEKVNDNQDTAANLDKLESIMQSVLSSATTGETKEIEEQSSTPQPTTTDESSVAE